MRTHSCPKCQGSMVEGYMLSERSGAGAVSGWIAGAPQKKWWGLKQPTKPVEIQTWRCQRCGFLENYAHG